MSNHIYQNLAFNNQEHLGEQTELSLNFEDKWHLQSRSEDNLNVYYHLCLVPPRGQKYVVKLPWAVQDLCFACKSYGLTFFRRQDQVAYEDATGQDCQGLELQSNENEINLIISDKMVGRHIIRKSLGSLWNANLVLRKSLILKLTWVESLLEVISWDAKASIAKFKNLQIDKFGLKNLNAYPPATSSALPYHCWPASAPA